MARRKSSRGRVFYYPSSLPKMQDGGRISNREGKREGVETKRVLNRGIDLEGLKEGISQAESVGGVLLMNPESTATGLYGQRFSEIKDTDLYSGTREEFSKDFEAQNAVFDKRFYEGLASTETTPLERDAYDLYKEYKPQIENFNYSLEDLAALSNFLGRQGTRTYLGKVVRDGNTLEEAFPTKFGKGAEQANKTPEEYLKITRPFYKKEDNLSERPNSSTKPDSSIKPNPNVRTPEEVMSMLVGRDYTRTPKESNYNSYGRVVKEVMDENKALYNVGAPKKFNIIPADERMAQHLKKTGRGLEYLDAEDTWIPFKDRPTAKLRIPGEGANRVVINTKNISNKDLKEAVALDFISHSMDEDKTYKKYKDKINTELVNKYGQEFIDRNGGIDAYVRGILASRDNEEYQPYREETDFLNKALVNDFKKYIKTGEKPSTGLFNFKYGGGLTENGTEDTEKVTVYVANDNTTWNPKFTDIINNPFDYSQAEVLDAVQRLSALYPPGPDEDYQKIITTPGVSPSEAGIRYVEKDPATGLPKLKSGGIPERYKNKGFTKVGAKKQSTRPGKKWMVLAKKGDDYKIVHGGYKGMKDFSQHGSEDRKKKFWSRMGGKNSSKAQDPFSPLYWHKRFGTWEYGGDIQQQGYKDNSPYKNRPYIDIYSNNITMDGVSQPLLVKTDTGQEMMLDPNSGEYYFPGANVVREMPLKDIPSYFSGSKINLTKYQKGGKFPDYYQYGYFDLQNFSKPLIKVTDPYDPRLLNFEDSLYFANKSNSLDYLENYKDKIIPWEKASRLPRDRNFEEYMDPSGKITPIGAIVERDGNGKKTARIPVYKYPTQPYLLVDDLVKINPENVERKEYVTLQNNLNMEKVPEEKVPYKKEPAWYQRTGFNSQPVRIQPSNYDPDAPYWRGEPYQKEYQNGGSLPRSQEGIEGIGKEVNNFKDFVITNEELNFLNSNKKEYCPTGNCLESTKKAFNLTAGKIKGVPDMYNVFENDLKVTSAKGKPTEKMIENNPWFAGDVNVSSSDSWDVQGNILNSEGQIVYNRNNPESAYYPGKAAIGSIYSFGPKGKKYSGFENRNQGYNTKFGLQPSHHSVSVVGFNKESNENVLYDSFLNKYLTESELIKELDEKLGYELETIGTPKSYINFTKENLESSDNFYNPNIMSPYKVDVNNLKKLTRDPAVKYTYIEDGKEKYRQPGFNSDAMKGFVTSLEDNKEVIMGATGISNEKYDRLADLAIALAMAETEGGDELSFDWLGETQGLTQLNYDNIKDDEILQKTIDKINDNVSVTNKINSISDLRTPSKSAIATIAYLSKFEDKAKNLLEKGEMPSERTFYDNTGFKDNFRYSSAKINKDGFYVDAINERIPFDKIEGWKEKDINKVTRYLNELTSTNDYNAILDDNGKIAITMKTKGNKMDMPYGKTMAYFWQSPNTLATGDAQGKSVYASRVSHYYDKIQDLKKNSKNSDLKYQTGGQLPRAQEGKQLPTYMLPEVEVKGYSNATPQQLEILRSPYASKGTKAALRNELKSGIPFMESMDKAGDAILNIGDKSMEALGIATDVGQFIPPIAVPSYLVGLVPTTYQVGKELLKEDYKQAGIEALGYTPSFYSKGMKIGTKIPRSKTNTVINSFNLANDLQEPAKDLQIKKQQEGGKLLKAEIMIDPATGLPKLKKGGKAWIQGAIKKPGALRATAKRAGAIKSDGTIKKSWLREKARDSGKTAQRARLALTLGKMRK